MSGSEGLIVEGLPSPDEVTLALQQLGLLGSAEDTLRTGEGYLPDTSTGKCAGCPELLGRELLARQLDGEPLTVGSAATVRSTATNLENNCDSLSPIRAGCRSPGFSGVKSAKLLSMIIEEAASGTAFGQPENIENQLWVVRANANVYQSMQGDMAALAAWNLQPTVNRIYRASRESMTPNDQQEEKQHLSVLVGNGVTIVRRLTEGTMHRASNSNSMAPVLSSLRMGGIQWTGYDGPVRHGKNGFELVRGFEEETDEMTMVMAHRDGSIMPRVNFKLTVEKGRMAGLLERMTKDPGGIRKFLDYVANPDHARVVKSRPVRIADSSSQELAPEEQQAMQTLGIISLEVRSEYLRTGN